MPPYLRRTKSLEELIPWLYLKGVSTGNFQEALAALLGAQAKGLSAGTISRLKAQRAEEHARWSQRSPQTKRHVYLWADGVYFNIRTDEAKQRILVIVGVDEQGHKAFLAIEDGYRESEQSWLELLTAVKARGLQHGAKLAVGDGALGFWKALAVAYGKRATNAAGCTRRPTCSTNCPRASRTKPRAVCMRSGWPRDPGRGPQCL